MEGNLGMGPTPRGPRGTKQNLRLSKAMATLKNFSRMDAKVQEVRRGRSDRSAEHFQGMFCCRDVIRMLEHNHTSTLEEPAV